MTSANRRGLKFVLGLMSTIILPIGFQTMAHARTRDITTVEARELVMAALDPSARKLPKLSIDLEDVKVPGFYEFAVTWDDPNATASVIVGFFAVNQATGDVWELVVCTRIDSPDLRRAQETIRRRIDLGRKELVSLGKKAACVP